MICHRYLLHGFVVCLLLTVGVPRGFADDAEQFRAKLQQIAATPFVGSAAEYKAFSQNLGDLLVATADAMLALPDLSPENMRYGILTKYWGLVRKYGFDDVVFEEELAAFLDSLQNIPEAESLYQSLMLDVFNKKRFYQMDTDEAIKAFLPFRERFVPFIDKYYREEDQSQLASRLIAEANLIDQDGSAGLIASTVEMLAPTLQEQEKSKDFLTSALAKSRPNGVRRVQMPGKEMILEGVDLDSNVVDVKDFAEKVVFLQFSTTDDKDRLPILKKLYATLHDHGFVFLDFNVRDNNRDVARAKAEELELPWIILCGSAAYEKKLENYDKYYDAHRCMFLVGRDGKVVGTWSRGLCPAVWEELIRQFPDQAEELANLAAEDEQTQRETREKYQAMWQAVGREDDGTGTETSRSLLTLLARMIRENRNHEKQRIQSLLELADLIRAMPDLSASQKRNVMLKRIDLMESLVRIDMKENPDTNPEIFFAEMLKEIDEALADDAINGLFNHELVMKKLFTLRAMRDYMPKADNKTAIANDILKRYVEILNKETQHTNYYGGDMFSAFANNYPDALIELGEKNSLELLDQFYDAVIPIFEQAKDPELQQFTKTLRVYAGRDASDWDEFEFECVLMNGETINVKDLRGKIVLVNFWSTTCGPCIREFPNMKTQYEKYKDKGYEMIALGHDNEVEKIAEFLEKHDYPWLTGSLVKSQDAGLVNFNYSFLGIPETFLLDRNGKVVFHIVGAFDERLNRELEKAFGE